MTPYETLVKKIHKHCPELLELNFGCEFRIISEEIIEDAFTFDFGGGEKHTTPKGDAGLIGKVLRYSGSYQIADTGDYSEAELEVAFFNHPHGVWKVDLYERYHDFDKTKDLEILGHPIQLQHVLRAMGNSNLLDRRYFATEIHRDFIFFISDIDRKTVSFDLFKPFSEQSAELYKWLNEVIS